VKLGDIVVLPFNIGCGFCRNCNAGLTGFCLTANPDAAGAAYGFAGMGPYQGGRAEYLRVPWADFNCLVLPEDAKEKENDYVMLADIFQPDRIKLIEQLGATAIDPSKGDPVEQVLELTGGEGAPDELSKHGKIAFDYGMLWFKGQQVGTGQCNVKAYNRRLGHELPLAEAPDAYNHFDNRDDGWTKVVVKPAA
jgi:glutathione-independent formaldehyde dehydrogenase